MPKKPPIRIAFIGHPELTTSECKKIVHKYFDKYEKKYEVVEIATIKDDHIGLVARKFARFLDIKRVTADRLTHERNLLPMELTAATLMWAADRFIIVHSNSKRSYSYMALEMCKRMPRRYLVVNLEAK